MLDESKDESMDEYLDSPIIKTSIIDRNFLGNLKKIKSNLPKLIKLQDQMTSHEEDIENELLDLNLFYLVHPEQNSKDF